VINALAPGRAALIDSELGAYTV